MRHQHIPDGTFPAVGSLLFDSSSASAGTGGWRGLDLDVPLPSQGYLILKKEKRSSVRALPSSHKFSVKEAKIWVSCMGLGGQGGVSYHGISASKCMEICKRPKIVTETKGFQSDSMGRTERNEHCPLPACVELLHHFLICTSFLLPFWLASVIWLTASWVACPNAFAVIKDQKNSFPHVHIYAYRNSLYQLAFLHVHRRLCPWQELRLVQSRLRLCASLAGALGMTCVARTAC